MRNGTMSWNKKALDDKIIEQQFLLDETRDVAIKKHEDAGKDLREQLAELTKKVDERKAVIQTKLPTPPASAAAAPAAQPPVAGAVTIEVAPGSILHSSHLDPTLVNTCLAQMGMNEEQSVQTSQMVFKFLNMLALQIAPPTQTTPVAAAPCPQQTVAVKESVVVQVDDERPEEQREEDVEFTDGSTDTAAETAAANDNTPYSKIKKKLTKKDRDAKNGKGGPGKGNSNDLVKSADKDKVKKK